MDVKQILDQIEKQTNEDFTDGVDEAMALVEQVKKGYRIVPEQMLNTARAFMFSMSLEDARKVLETMEVSRRGRNR